MSDRTFGQ